jgi:hypothetical protein
VGARADALSRSSEERRLQIDILDEKPGLAPEKVLRLTVAAPTVTARELIRARVMLEVERLLAELEALESEAARRQGRLAERMKSFLVIPSAAERTLNGDRGAYGPGTRSFPRHGASGPFGPAHRGLPPGADAEALADDAVAAFERGRFFLLVDDRQVTDLDEALGLAETSNVTFLRLTPLQGG